LGELRSQRYSKLGDIWRRGKIGNLVEILALRRDLS
jgi:hypothetical protein